jgi:pilus assembly protein CpaB
MTRNTRMLVVLGIAVMVAGLATYGVVLAVRARPAPPADPTVDVVVASTQIETGVCLAKDQVKLLTWPAKYRPAGAFAKIDDAVGRSLITAGVENEPITENKLATRDAGCGLPPTIASGRRAMSVKVNEVIGVAGFVTPGTRVDVLVTLQENNDTMSRVVVRNVQVLTAGTRYDEAAAKAQGKPIPSSVVTLMVTPTDAERIALAASRGQIMLALRNPLDNDKVEPLTPGVRIGELMGRPAAAPPPPPPTGRGPAASPARPQERVQAPAPAPPPVARIEVWRGTKRAEEVIP